MQSIWKCDKSFRKRNALHGKIKTDVAIIGAGISGILTAYMLKQKGIDSVIIEADEICSGQTENTTAKITLQHGLIYNNLINRFGEDKAWQYAEANRLAIENYRKIITDNNIDCMFEVLPAYLYSTRSTVDLEKEYNAAKRLGIEAELTSEVSLPFKVVAALRFDNQAQFHPLKFLSMISDGLEIYEKTAVTEIDDGKLITNRGEVLASKIVCASHFPFINTPGYYFLRMHQERSYVIALDTPAEISGMHLGIDEDGLSFRRSVKYLLIGGGNHRTGENEAGGKYEMLRQAAKKYFPEANDVAHWSAQDCMPIDGVPFIGKFSSSLENVYVATGFQKWGMTTSMVAAMILSEMIEGKNHPYPIFSPQRFNISASAKSLATEAIQAVRGLSAEFFTFPKENADKIPRGKGAIVEYNGEKVGVYKDENGDIYAVSTKCPHLGCQLTWNPDEKSWDCPCHGSRFDYKGNLINNPAIKNLSSDRKAD